MFLYHVPDLLHFILPGYVGGVCPGAITPSGVQLQYQVNGLQAWAISNGKCTLYRLSNREDRSWIQIEVIISLFAYLVSTLALYTEK